MQKALCLKCHSELIVDNEVVVGDLVTCNNCQTDMEVLTLHPLKLDIIPEE